MAIPKTWVQIRGDSVATMVFRSPTARQDIRIAPIGADRGLLGDAGIARVREVLARFPFATVLEQVTVIGATGGAIITYEIGDGAPDAEAENSLHSVCIP